MKVIRLMVMRMLNMKSHFKFDGWPGLFLLHIEHLEKQKFNQYHHEEEEDVHHHSPV